MMRFASGVLARRPDAIGRCSLMGATSLQQLRRMRRKSVVLVILRAHGVGWANAARAPLGPGRRSRNPEHAEEGPHSGGLFCRRRGGCGAGGGAALQG